jgi:putative transcriptional regulator
VKPLVTVPGSVLAAAPDMLDPNFMHAVVLMCRHSEEGAFGFVINRPASVTLDVLAPSHPLLKHRRFPIFTGGPVGLDTLQFLHRAGNEIPGGAEIETGLWLGGEIDALAAYLEANPETAPKNVRLLVGYSGWGAGQLEGELASGSWLPAPLETDWVFGGDGQTTWRSVLKSLGGRASGLADLPPDPSWN